MKDDLCCTRLVRFQNASMESNRNKLWKEKLWMAAILIMLISLTAADFVYAQDDSVAALAERSSIVILGKVVKVRASEEPLQAASEQTLVVKVTRMFAGAEVAGDQANKNVTIILRKRGEFRTGTEALFFGNPLFAGRTLTIADEGEIVTGSKLEAFLPELARGVQARKDKPIVERLSAASKVFQGVVISVRPPERSDEKETARFRPRSEHDPEWQAAAVRITSPLRNAEKDTTITVLFPGSQDIEWFNSPKLKPDQSAIFITHRPAKEEELLLRASGVALEKETQPVELVTQPFDLLPLSETARVEGLLKKATEVK